VDGEIVGFSPPLEYSLRRDALQVVRPAPVATAADAAEAARLEA